MAGSVKTISQPGSADGTPHGGCIERSVPSLPGIVTTSLLAVGPLKVASVYDNSRNLNGSHQVFAHRFIRRCALRFNSPSLTRPEGPPAENHRC